MAVRLGERFTNIQCTMSMSKYKEIYRKDKIFRRLKRFGIIEVKNIAQNVER